MIEDIFEHLSSLRRESRIVQFNAAERLGATIIVQGDFEHKCINQESSQFSGVILHGEVTSCQINDIINQSNRLPSPQVELEKV